MRFRGQEDTCYATATTDIIQSTFTGGNPNQRDSCLDLCKRMTLKTTRESERIRGVLQVAYACRNRLRGDVAGAIECQG